MTETQRKVQQTMGPGGWTLLSTARVRAVPVLVTAAVLLVTGLVVVNNSSSLLC